MAILVVLGAITFFVAADIYARRYACPRRTWQGSPQRHRSGRYPHCSSAETQRLSRVGDARQRFVGTCQDTGIAGSLCTVLAAAGCRLRLFSLLRLVETLGLDDSL